MFYLCIYLFGLFGTGFFKPIHLGSVISCQWLQPRDILVKCICLIYFLKNAFFEQKSNQNQLRLKKKKKKEKNRTVTVIPSPGFPRAVWLPSLPPCRCSPLLCWVPDWNIKQWSCPTVRWECWVPRQAELTASVPALIPWPRMRQREEGADPVTAEIPKGGVRTEGMVQGKERGGRSESVQV